MPELKPCPFCGGEAAIVKLEPRLHRPLCNRPYTVYCPGCGLFFGWDADYGGVFETKEEAITAWNQRYKEG